MPKILKAGATSGGKGKKKVNSFSQKLILIKIQKWSKSKSKEKLNNAVFWTKPVWDKLLKDVVTKEAYLTPSVISEKLKINV